MKNLLVLILTLSGNLFVAAQSIKPSVGKKMQVVVASTNTISVSSMGENVDIESSGTTTCEYQITQVTEKGYSLQTKLLRVQNTGKVLGEERSFDSDNEIDRNDPGFAEAAKLLGKTNEIKIEDHRASVVSGDVLNSLAQIGMKDATSEFVKFILYKDDLAKMRTGYHWMDSLQTEVMKLSSESEVTAMTEAVIEITVKTKMNMNITSQQMGMEVKMGLTGTIYSKRYYSTATGIMISEEGDAVADGDGSTMGQQIPMKMKAHIKMTVK